MKNKTEILCTLGKKTINKNFLSFLNNRASLIRINLSHINIKNLKKNIILIRKYCSVPICIDTEGAQIRAKVKKQKKYNTGSLGYIHKDSKNFHLYPTSVFSQVKKNDVLEIGFDNLKIKIILQRNSLSVIFF